MLGYFSVLFLFIVADAQTVCQYGRHKMGVCKPYKDCPKLHDSVIFPNAKCEPDTICCPNDRETILIELPELKTKPVPKSTPTPASADLPISTRVPLDVSSFPLINDKVSLVNGTDSIHLVEDDLHPRGLNILHSQRCGFVYASKNPNGSNVEADIFEFPWMARLKYANTANGQQEFACGGSLITERWVLTSAQCIKPNLIGVRLGEYDIKENTKKDCTQEKGVKTCSKFEDFRISKTFTHPDYDQNIGLKDIGLVKLKTRAQRSKNIKPICLPTEPECFDEPYDDKDLIIAGWKSAEGDPSTILKKHVVKQHSLLVCTIGYPSKHDSKMCLAGDDDELNTCSGEPGSPVSLKIKYKKELYVQIGIVPFGMDKCGGEQTVLYYVENVVDSMDWITKVIGEDK